MSRTEVIEPWQTDGVKVTITITTDGKTRVTETFYHYDGKDYKPTGGVNTFVPKRVDANTVTMTFKQGGKVVATSKSVLSKDGKVRTLTLTGTNAKGQKVHEVMVFDKQ